MEDRRKQLCRTWSSGVYAQMESQSVPQPKLSKVGGQLNQWELPCQGPWLNRRCIATVSAYGKGTASINKNSKPSFRKQYYCEQHRSLAVAGLSGYLLC